jgi:hypothetical protein
MLGHAFEDALGLVEAGPGEHEVDHTLSVARPLLDLVEVAPVGEERISVIIAKRRVFSFVI